MHFLSVSRHIFVCWPRRHQRGKRERYRAGGPDPYVSSRFDPGSAILNYESAPKQNLGCAYTLTYRISYDRLGVTVHKLHVCHWPVIVARHYQRPRARSPIFFRFLWASFNHRSSDKRLLQFTLETRANDKL